MNELAENEELRHELGEKGYAAYRKYWDEEAHLEQYLGLIERIRDSKAVA